MGPPLALGLGLLIVEHINGVLCRNLRDVAFHSDLPTFTWPLMSFFGIVMFITASFICACGGKKEPMPPEMNKPAPVPEPPRTENLITAPPQEKPQFSDEDSGPPRLSLPEPTPLTPSLPLADAVAVKELEAAPAATSPPSPSSPSLSPPSAAPPRPELPTVEPKVEDPSADVGSTLDTVGSDSIGSTISNESSSEGSTLEVRSSKRSMTDAKDKPKKRKKRGAGGSKTGSKLDSKNTSLTGESSLEIGSSKPSLYDVGSIIEDDTPDGSRISSSAGSRLELGSRMSGSGSKLGSGSKSGHEEVGSNSSTLGRNSKLSSRSGSKLDSKSGSKADSKAGSKMDEKSSSKADSKISSKTDSKVRSKTSMKSSVKEELKTDSKSDSKSDEKSPKKTSSKMDRAKGSNIDSKARAISSKTESGNKIQPKTESLFMP